MYHLKKLAPQACLPFQGLKRLLRLCDFFALNNYEYMVHHIQIYRNHPK